MPERRICKIDGCDKPHKARGWCDRHYRRALAHGSPFGGRVFRGEIEAFFERSMRLETDDCIEWPYGKTVRGYGQMTLRGRKVMAHREALRRKLGRPIADRHDACHVPIICNSRACINKRHLYEGTRRQNMADTVLDGTRNWGERNGQSKLTRRDILAIREDTRSGSRVGADYGISASQVWRIRRRKRWKHF